MALVDVWRTYHYAPAQRKVLVKLPPEATRQATNTCAGCCNTALCGTRDAAQHWEGKLAPTLSDLKLIGGIACPCVWQGCIKGEHTAATVHEDDITIGGKRPAVEFLIKVILGKYEIKKQVIGEDADFEKSGSILIRVIEWCRDGITIEADQRHVREMLKGLELERANHSATPCAVERKKEGNARSDESKGEN